MSQVKIIASMKNKQHSTFSTKEEKEFLLKSLRQIEISNIKLKTFDISKSNCLIYYKGV